MRSKADETFVIVGLILFAYFSVLSSRYSHFINICTQKCLVVICAFLKKPTSTGSEQSCFS